MGLVKSPAEFGIQNQKIYKLWNSIMHTINKLLREIGSGRTTSTVYDTAWLARLGNHAKDLSNPAMEWLCENQHPDGSWGAKEIYYYHDRVICTLSAMIVLAQRGRRTYDKVQIEKGLYALEKITAGATGGLASDPNGSTVGFEMIVPTLVSEAEKLGLITQQGDRILGRMSKMRAKKLEKLAGWKINRFVTPAFSSEMVGHDGQNILEVDNLQEPNGSVANSPSATAFFAMHLKPAEEKALNYLNQTVNQDHGAPAFAPIDIFEVAWTLWNIKLISNLDGLNDQILKSHLDFLNNNWNDESGIGTASAGTIKDGDDSGLVYEVLSAYGIPKSIDAILSYEEVEHFRCFSLESNPSISTNIHILGALKQAGIDKENPSARKIFTFLKSVMQPAGFWFDKWHASPYYSTSHAVITFCGYDNTQAEPAVEWILSTQNSNGSWGHYRIPTPEETSYCLQALSAWYPHSKQQERIKESIKLAHQWLVENSDIQNPPLWIGKALYCPSRVVQSSILSAIKMAEHIL
jgi:halimadienyl-diphosphate synthase